MSNPLKTLAFGALVACAAACSKSGSAPSWLIERIDVSAETLQGNPALPATADQVRDQLLAALEADGRFRTLRPDEDAPAKSQVYRLRLEVAFTRDSREERPGRPPGSLAEVGVVSELRRSGDPERYEATGLGRQSFELADEPARLAAFRRALVQSLGQAIESQALQLSARDKPDPELAKDLSHKDPRIRSYAARFLGERKCRDAVPALLDRLGDTDREVVMRAVGALGAIGDKRAVPALIAMPQSRDVQFMRTLVEVVASIGGEDADGFLFTLASGHPDEAVRAIAEEAQQRRRREQENP